MPDRQPVSLSIVIVSRRGGADLIDCVVAYAGAAGAGTEIIVSECAATDMTERIHASCPSVRVIHFAERRPIPDLRAAGMLAAQGDLIALASDRGRPADGWAAAVTQSHASSSAIAIGGAIEYEGSASVIDWAMFLLEYGRYMRPSTAAETIDLPAHNVCYKRRALDELSGLLAPSVWEPLWHRRLRERGHRLERDPAIVVTLRLRGSAAGFVRERYHYARSFAGQRVRARSVAYRAVYAAGTWLLPLLVAGRLIRDVLPKRRHVGKLVLGLPYIALLLTAWAAGECIGAVAGPGRSPDLID